MVELYGLIVILFGFIVNFSGIIWVDSGFIRFFRVFLVLFLCTPGRPVPKDAVLRLSCLATGGICFGH